MHGSSGWGLCLELRPVSGAHACACCLCSPRRVAYRQALGRRLLCCFAQPISPLVISEGGETPRKTSGCSYLQLLWGSFFMGGALYVAPKLVLKSLLEPHYSRLGHKLSYTIIPSNLSFRNGSSAVLKELYCEKKMQTRLSLKRSLPRLW